MDRREFWAACQRAPIFKEPGGADWQHPAAMNRGLMGKMGSPEKEFEFLWLLGWWVHPAAAALTKKTSLSALCFTLCIYTGGGGKLWVALDDMKLRWSSHDGECSSWTCNCCLYEAVFSGASYLLGTQVVHILTARHIRLSVRLALPPLPPTHLPFTLVPPCPDRWSKLFGANTLYYAKHVTLAGYR